MSAVIAVEYECGNEYEVRLTPEQRRIKNPKIKARVFGDLAKVLHARHERECDTCLLNRPDLKESIQQMLRGEGREIEPEELS